MAEPVADVVEGVALLVIHRPMGDGVAEGVTSLGSPREPSRRNGRTLVGDLLEHVADALRGEPDARA